MNNNCITTYTGKHIDLLHPDPDMICIEDIAHALSLICRGNGQVKTFFSVGQHCINCAREALARGYSRRVAFACLLHDASECYLSDVPRPFKKTLSGYKEKEKNLLDLIYQKYLGSSLNAKEEQLLKEIMFDLMVCEIENWDKKEYINELKKMLNGINTSNKKKVNVNSLPDLFSSVGL